MLIAYAGSTSRICAHFVQLRSTEPSEEMRMPSMSKRMPLQRTTTGEEAVEDVMPYCIGTLRALPLRRAGFLLRAKGYRGRIPKSDRGLHGRLFASALDLVLLQRNGAVCNCGI